MKLKKRMTFDEMAEHMTENTVKVANRITVGKYAKKLGYGIYRPMIEGRVMFYYVNEEIGK